LTEMWPEFKDASSGAYMEKHYKNKFNKLNGNVEAYKFTYRGPVMKTTTATLSDANGGVDRSYMKLNAAGDQDKGYYSAAKAWSLQARGTGSSTAIPQSLGPILASQRIAASVNQSPFKGITPAATPANPDVAAVKLPPNPPVGCAQTRIDLANLMEVTEENLDMDGLNADADCDDDEVLRAANQAHDDMCLAEIEKNATYECGDYPEPVCHVPGQGAPLPGQMFTNNEAYKGTIGVNAASSALPTLTALVVVVAATLL